jgi:beta-amylase
MCRTNILPVNAGTLEDTSWKDAVPLNVFNYSAFGVPVYVMMPLNSVSVSGDLVENYDGYDLQWILKQWKKNGVYGLMVDVWFGIVEKKPKEYHWEPYIKLCQHLREAGLKLQTVMSFHRCGGNVGDRCYIPLPQWVLDAAANNSDIFFKDQEGNVDPEYISWGVDLEPAIAGRSAVQIYSDFLSSFRDNLREFLGDVIVQVQIGLGPAGELRYPSYQLNRWTFCGVGEFQCYDRYLLSRLEQAAKEVGHSDWAHPPYPYDVGNYNSRPEETLFFKEDGGIWNTQYGDFFLRWYSEEMIAHADRILQVANDIFFGDKNSDLIGKIRLAIKIAGVHWNFRSKSHASELTAGYYNTRFRDGYTPIFKILKKNNATAVFTCTEMRDKNQPQDCNCSPEDLVGLIVRASIATNVSFAGENAVSFYDADSYRQISLVARSYSVVRGIPMEAMTYLRWPEPITIFMGNNFITPLGQKFFEFVRVMGTDDAISHVIPVF